MEAVRNINLPSLLDTGVSLVTAFLLGSLIGLERQYRQRLAGLRTNALVAVGAAFFVDVANRLQGHDGATHVLAYVVSGVGFLGGGVILREQGNVRGLNTAATLWGSAAVGASAGADLILEAVAGACFVMAANTLLRPVANRINRQPLDTLDVETLSTVYVIAPRDLQKQARQLLEAALGQAGYPISKLVVHSHGKDDVEIEATLGVTSVDGASMDGLVAKLSAEPSVLQAFWSPTATG
jgi:putative Mg2+ transporter-C (MgtC) family protein